MAAMLNELHALALKLAPELAGAELRLLRHQADWPAVPHAEAYAIVGKTLHVRDHLQSAGDWNGRWGSTIVFVAEPSVPLLLHELSHILPARQAVDDDGVEATSGQRQSYEIHLRQMVQRSANREGEPWRGHDLHWIRRALHLIYRAERLGIEVSHQQVNVAGDAYALSNVWDYNFRLASEALRFSLKTFSEIEAEPLLPPFVRLFLNDATRWHEFNLMEKYR
jgi:hypothetical protein